MKMLMKGAIVFLICFLSLSVYAQDWNEKQCAVVLTYDDALNVHLDHAIPALDSLQLKGTFFLTAFSAAFTNRLEEWKKVAANKHELGNHTLFHPCDGSRPGRGFVTPDYDLASYSVRRITDEISMTNTVLEAIDGKKERTFAYPCGDTHIGDSAYLAPLKGDFIAARGVQSGMLQQKNVDLYNVDCYVINGQSGDELIELVKEAVQTKSLLVFLFHGVGGEHALNVSLDAHNKLLHYLKENDEEIWNTTFAEVTRHIKATSGAKQIK